MSKVTAIDAMLQLYRQQLVDDDWKDFTDFDLLWTEELQMHYFIRKGQHQNVGFSIAITHMHRRYRITTLVFKTQYSQPEDILYADPLDSGTIQTDLVFLLMHNYRMTGADAKGAAFFTWTKRDSFSKVLNRLQDTLRQYVLPWFDEKAQGMF